MDTAEFNSKHPRDKNRWTDKLQSVDEIGQIAPELSPEDRAVAVYMSSYMDSEAGARDSVQHAMARAAAYGIDAVAYAEYEEGAQRLRKPGMHNIPTVTELYDARLTINDVEDVLKLNRGRYESSLRLLMVDNGLTAARIKELTRAGVPQSAEALIAMRTAPHDIAAQWAAANKNPEVREWLGGWGASGQLLLAGISAESAAEYSEAGVNVWAVIMTKGRFSPDEARDFARDSELPPVIVGEYMKHNITNAINVRELVAPATAREFGPKFEPREVADLHRLKVNPKTARRLQAVGHSTSPQDMQILIQAGIVTSSEYRRLTDYVWARGTSGGDSIQRIIEAKHSGA
jgi:hypothetical protein